MYTTLKQITGNIKGYGVQATSIEGQNDFAQNRALHKIYAPINVKPAGGGRARDGKLKFFQKINLLSNFLNKMKCEDKTVKFTQLSLALILIFDCHDFQTVRRMHEGEMSDRYQSLSSESGVKIYPHAGEERFKYPHPQENKISQMPHWYPRANPHPMLCLPPASFTFIGALHDRRSKPARLNYKR